MTDTDDKALADWFQTGSIHVLEPNLTEYHILYTISPLSRRRDNWEDVRRQWLDSEVEFRKARIDLVFDCTVGGKQWRYGMHYNSDNKLTIYVSEVTDDLPTPE